MKKSKLSVLVQPSMVIRILGTIVVILICAGIAVSYFRSITGRSFAYGLVPAFELYRENNIPTFFSSVLMLISAGLLGIIAISKRRRRDMYSTHWLILSIIFLCLSIDEVASLHDLLTKPLRHALNLSGILHFSWVIVGFIFVLFFMIFYLRFFFSLPSRIRYYFLISAFFLIGGAIGVELIGGYYIDIHRTWDLTYGFITTVEESFEMIGVLLFVIGLLKYIEGNISNVDFSFR